MSDFIVRHLIDDTYQVIGKEGDNDYDEYGYSEVTAHQGSLADCEAYIRLSEGGYLE